MKKYLLALLGILVCHISYAQIHGNIMIDENDITISHIMGYDKIEYKDALEFSDNIGAPSVPQLCRHFVVPISAENFNVSVSIVRSDTISISFLPLPVQPAVPIDTQSGNDFVLPDTTIYYGSDLYPHTRCEIISDNIMYGYRIISVCFIPFAYDPLSQNIVSFSFNYSLNWENTSNSQSIRPIPKSERRKSLIRQAVCSLVENPDDIDVYYPNSTINNAPEEMELPQFSPLNRMMRADPVYIIITNLLVELD